MLYVRFLTQGEGGQEIATWQGWAYRPEDGKVAGLQTPEGWISHEYDPRGAWPSRLVFPQTRPTTGGPVIQVASNRAEVTSGVKKFGPGDAVANTNVPGTEHSYTYDAIGNRKTSQTPTSQTSEATWVANSVNQYTSRTNANIIAQLTGEVAPAATVSATFDGLGGTMLRPRGGLFAASKTLGASGAIAK